MPQAKRSVNVARDISVQSRGMDKKMSMLSKWSRRALPSIVRDSSRIFIESAQKYTPPDKGRTSIKAANMKRRIITGIRLHGKYSDPDEGRRWSFGSAKFKVPWRTSRHHGVKYFKTMREARDFAQIWFRGVARLGWFAGLSALGFVIPLSYRLGVRAYEMAQSVNLMKVRLKDSRPYVVITNRARNISRFALYSKVIGLRRVNSMLGFLVRQEKAKLKLGRVA